MRVGELRGFLLRAGGVAWRWGVIALMGVGKETSIFLPQGGVLPAVRRVLGKTADASQRMRETDRRIGAAAS